MPLIVIIHIIVIIQQHTTAIIEGGTRLEGHDPDATANVRTHDAIQVVSDSDMALPSGGTRLEGHDPDARHVAGGVAQEPLGHDGVLARVGPVPRLHLLLQARTHTRTRTHTRSRSRTDTCTRAHKHTRQPVCAHRNAATFE